MTTLAKTLDGDKRPLDDATVSQLSAALRGELIRPGDERYDSARHIYNGMIDRHPALIARCAGVADVMSAGRYACERDLLMSIRSGGHNGPGLSLCDDGLVVDLSSMKGIRVDPAERTARVESGCTWGDVDHATHAFGLATVSGIVSTTGVGGLTLGGGHGYLSRKYGLTIDNLVSADVVLAGGRLVTASAEHHADLFWALRGGGGNFGVVTSFVYRLHPVDTIFGGPMFWPLEQAEELMRWYREFLPDAPQDLYGFLGFMQVPSAPPFPESLHGQKVCGAVWCYTGPPAHAERAMAPVRELGPPLYEHLGVMPYPALQSAFDRFYPPGLQWYWKGDFVRELTDEAIAAHMRFKEVVTPLSTMHLYPIDGAVHRVGAHETAWAYRDATWSMVIAGVAETADEAASIRAWAHDYWRAVHPHSAGASYVNFMMEEGPERIQAAYRDNYARLAHVKAVYDPENRFRVNQNISPAA